MNQKILPQLLIDQSKDLFWVVDQDLHIIYANKSYMDTTLKTFGTEVKLNESIFVKGVSEDDIERWGKNYSRAFKGENFEIEEHYFNPKSNETEYIQVTFEPLRGDDGKIFAIACQSKDITKAIKFRAEGSELMNASLDVFCTIDSKGNFVFVSAASTKIWGYTPQELIGTPYVDLILEEDLSKTGEVVASIVSGQETNTFVNRYKKKGGGIAYNLWSAKWDDAAKLMYCTARDGKEKILQEEKIQLSEQRFKALVQEGSDLISILDQQGNYIYISPSKTALPLFEQKPFISKSAFDFIHPEDLEKAKESFLKTNSNEKVHMEPYRFINRKKEWRWIETVLTNMLHNPAVKGIVANSRDITDKIKEKHQLKLLESVITNTKDAVLITEAEPFDLPGPKIIYVNEAFTKMTGYNAHEVIGKTPRILQGPNSDKKELAKLSKAIRNWEPCEITSINYKKNQEEFWINFTITPVANENGWYTHWVAIEREVTEQKNKAQEKELLAEISINFNTENEYIDAANALCKTISKFGKFDIVELWTPNIQKSQMQLFSHYVIDKEDEIFYESNQNKTIFSFEEGFVGKVWKQKEIQIWEASEPSNPCSRKDAAIKIGIKAVMGIPLIFQNKIKGILQLGTKSNTNHLKKYSQLFKRLETFIGSEINRKKLENELEHLFSSIPDIISVLDFEGKFLKINEAGCKLLGYQEEEILYSSFDKFLHPEEKGLFKNKINSQKKEDISFKFENRYITKTGEIIWLSWYCSLDWKEELIYATSKNITEEKKLRELNRQVGYLARIGSWEVDLIKQTIFWSDMVHELHETDSKSYVPNLADAINFYREDFRQLVQDGIANCIATGNPYDFEAVIITTNKKELWVRALGDAEVIDGECRRLYGSFQDINSIKEAENRILSLSENLPGAVYQYLIHPDGTDSLKYVSGEVKELWGFTTKQVTENINLIWNQIKAGGDYDNVKEDILRSIKTKSKWTSTFTYVMPNGDIRTHLGNGMPIFMTDGTILFNSIVLDISQERENEELLSQASHMARIGSWELDLINQDDKDCVYWSPMVKDILEVDDTYNPTYNSWLELHIGESKERAQQAIETLITEGIPFDLEILLVTGKGKERWIRFMGKSKKLNHKISKIYGSFQDIHERKEAEVRLQSLAENLPGVVFQYLIYPDGTDTLKHVTKGSQRTWGYSPEEVLENNQLIWERIIAGGDFNKVNKSIEDAIKSKTDWFSRWKYVLPNGETRTHAGYGSPTFLANGTVIFNSLILDITDQAKNEELIERYTIELERSNEELEQFAFVASHDLQEPLRMISSFMELLKRKYSDQLDEKAQQYIYFATDGAKRMKQIILDLLEYSRTSRPTEKETEVNFNTILSDFKQLRRKIISEKMAVIKSIELPTLRTHKAAITQIIHCLLDNALKYQDDKDTPIIEIYALENKKEWVFSVKDNGIGIDANFHDKIFVIFQRLHNKSDYDGTGIGLSIAKRHVEFLGGRIWLESESGKGATFYFTIPKLI